MILQRGHIFVPSLLIVFAVIPFAQERVSKKGPPEFKELHAAVARAHDAGNFGLAVSKAKELVVVLQAKWSKAILAALPAAPDGFAIVPQEKQDPRAAGMLAAVASAVGTVVEQKYEGNGQTITTTIQADSPLIQMFSMWVANPTMLGPDAELVKYGDINAVLRNDGGRWSLQILIGTSIVEVEGADDDEFLLRLFDQAAVDALGRVLVI